MNIILVGPPGAGKGTQAVKIAKELDLPHISTGDIFRQAVSEGTPLGLKAKSFMDQGELVPDEVVIGIVEERLKQEDALRGFILDGFPRTLPQARALDEALAKDNRGIDLAIEINVNEDELVTRLAGRRVCRNCGTPYHVKFNPPKNDSVCDVCGGEVYQRADDEETTIRNRLNVYKDQTEPLIAYYDDRGSLARIDGAKPVDEVTEDMTKAIKAKVGS